MSSRLPDEFRTRTNAFAASVVRLVCEAAKRPRGGEGVWQAIVASSDLHRGAYDRRIAGAVRFGGEPTTRLKVETEELIAIKNDDHPL